MGPRGLGLLRSRERRARIERELSPHHAAEAAITRAVSQPRDREREHIAGAFCWAMTVVGFARALRE